MNKFAIFGGIVLGVLGVILLFFIMTNLPTIMRIGGGSSYVYMSLSNGKTIKIIETARTEQERAKGLSGRDKIKPSEGMWFGFDQPGYYPFWMKDMKFDIDIIFLDQNYIVTDIFQNVPAPLSSTEGLPTYQSTRPAQYVLEVLAGVSTGVVVGDKVTSHSQV